MGEGLKLMKVLVTGGAGFIGSSLSKACLEVGYDVRILDSLSQQVHGECGNSLPAHLVPIAKDIEFIKGSVQDKSVMDVAVRDIDIVVHLAAETGTGQSMYEIQRYYDANVLGTAVLMQSIADDPSTKVSKIIVASSRSIYGEGVYYCLSHGEVIPNPRNDLDLSLGDFECKCPICGGAVSLKATHENAILKPGSIYACTKRAQEELVLSSRSVLGIPSIALRLQNVFGVGQSLSNPYTGILSIFSNRISLGKKIEIFEDGLESRDFVYISDVVSAFMSSIMYEEVEGVFNIGSGSRKTVLNVVEALQLNMGADVEVEVTGSYRIGDIRHNFADLSLASRDLNFVPKQDFYSGVKEFCQWVKNMGPTDDYYDRSLSELSQRGLLKGK